MNAYTVTVIRGKPDAQFFDVATYAAAAISSAQARENVLEIERATGGAEPLRASFADPATEPLAAIVKHERVPADVVAGIEARADAYVVGAP